MGFRLVFFRLPSRYWEQALSLRFEVFVDEMQIEPQWELDCFDYRATHACLLHGNQVVGTLRLVPSASVATIGRVAVASAYRAQGWGKYLMRRALQWCRQHGFRDIQLAAQIHVIPFYAGLGFSAEGGVFDDAGRPHQRMIYRG